MKTNTELCIDLKTKLQNDVLMKPGKDYPGILRRNNPNEEFGLDDNSYTFVETIPSVAEKRNPQIFRGKFITITRKDDGSYRPNFKPMRVDADFCIERYALGVYNELCIALGGLIEEE